MWPNQFITELLVPWVVGISLTSATKMGHIHEIVLYGVWIVGSIYLIKFLRFLGVPTLQEAITSLRALGILRCGQAFIVAAICWRNVVYMFPLARNLSLLSLFGGEGYCYGPESIIPGLGYPPCPKQKLGDITGQIELPWTQDSLVQQYFTMRQPLDSWGWYYDSILCAILGILHLSMFRLGGYAVSRFPVDITTYFLVREPQFLAFSAYQVLRFLANGFPRFVCSLFYRLIRILQLPFRKALANTRRGTRTVFSALPWFVLTTIVELYLIIDLLTPELEWELQYHVLLLKVKVMFLWALLSALFFLVWSREWARNVTFPDDPSVLDEYQKFQGPIPDFLRCALHYWDGFWRHDECIRRGVQGVGQKEYMQAFNASGTFCKALGYLAYLLFGLYYINQVVGVIQRYEGYQQLLWELLVPTSVIMILDENFFDGKRDRHTFMVLEA